MTTPEMHIQVNLGVQGLGPSRFDDFLEEEIDYALNKGQEQIVKQSYGFNSRFRPGGFEESQKRIDDLSGLIVDATIPTYVYTEGYSTGNKFTTVAADLPDNYMFLINNKGEIMHNNCATVTKSAATTSFSYYAFTIPELTSYSNFSIFAARAGVTVKVSGTAPTASNSSELLYWLLYSPNSLTSGYTAYYEQYEDLHLPGQVILVHSDSDTGAVMNTTGVAPGADTIPAFTSYTTTRQYRQDGGYTGREVRRLKFIQQDDIDIVLRDPFNTPIITDPVATMNNRKLLVYESDIFIVPNIFLRYLKQPRRISLSLNLDCELAEHLHSEVVQAAVQILLSDTSNPRVRQAENDLLRSE